MRVSRHALTVVALDGIIYAIGGTTSGNTGFIDSQWTAPEEGVSHFCCEIVEKYDPNMNSWSFCAPLLTPRRLHGTAACGGRIYVFGGCCEEKSKWFTAEAEMYDVEVNTWTALPSMPIAGGASAVAVNDLIFVLIHGKGLYLFDQSQHSYIHLGAFPVPDWHCFSVTQASHSVFVSGGTSEGRLCVESYSFDSRRVVIEKEQGGTVLDMKWRREAPLPKGRRRSALVAVERTSKAAILDEEFTAGDGAKSSSSVCNETNAKDGGARVESPPPTKGNDFTLTDDGSVNDKDCTSASALKIRRL